MWDGHTDLLLGADHKPHFKHWDLIYKISYNKLTIILQYCQSYDRPTMDV